MSTCRSIPMCIQVPRVRAAAALLLLTAMSTLRQAQGQARGQAAGPPVQARQALSSALVLDGVTVVDVEHGTLLRDQRVVIAGTRIRAVARRSATPLPAGAQVVEARGKYLIPGLWDMHTHLGNGVPPTEQSAAVRIAHLALLSNGITGIRDAGSPVPLDSSLAWRRAILAGERIGPPRQLLAGPFLEEKVPPQWTHAVEAPTLAAARRIVDLLLAAGADHIKVHDFSEALHDSIVAELRGRHILFGGHMRSFADTGARFFDHGFYSRKSSDIADGPGPNCFSATATLAHCRRVAERMRRHDIWLVLSPFGGGAQLAAARAWQRLSPAQQARVHPDGSHPTALSEAEWVAVRDSLAQLAKHPPREGWAYLRIAERVGLPLLAGADFAGWHGLEWAAGAAVPDGLTNLVQRGMSPLAALQVATLNPAKALHATDSLGTVAPGKLADLVLLDGNPLVDIRHVTAIRGVVANGRYFDRATLDSLLADVDFDLATHHWND